ncbi:hypothetical protein [Rhizobium leguminosarum]|uniref:hypothetical protein n=1 Tax=Rhizobium leguminosarum TaxID=384 RepID=UPI00140FAC72|nr:hypothetical protein [Rhizobium leguminosarum]QIO57325.1 hypothetical protein HA463_06235 [Rhizobium leguminosarum bv. trifolii]
MLDRPIQAAGEAVLTRRQLIATSSAAAVVGVAGLVPIAAVAAVADDPILSAIGDYRHGWAEFHASDDRMAEVMSHLWKAPYAVLANWTAPATTRAGAMAALRLAVDEDENGDSPVVGTMMRAALAYLEQEGAL